jgi:hypothetical protein
MVCREYVAVLVCSIGLGFAGTGTGISVLSIFEYLG